MKLIYREWRILDLYINCYTILKSEQAQVRQLFKFSKVGTIAGVYVTDGLVRNGANARLIRDGIVVVESKIATLQREKDQVKEVKNGYECGLTLDKYSDIKVDDTIEVYEEVEIKR